MLERLTRILPSQRNTGQIIGAVHSLLGRTTFYISIINFFLLIATAYYTTFRNFISIPFTWFMLVMVLIVGIAMVLEYVVILPSSVMFSNMQSYKHENPLKDDIKLILNRLDDIEDKLNR
jgi:hypothetical protein